MWQFLKVTNETFSEKGITIPLPAQATIIIEERLEKGIQAQADIFGEHMKEVQKAGHINRWLAAFMMSSILLNPQLIIYSAVFGKTALIVMIVTCFLCDILAGLLIWIFYRKKELFDFTGFDESKNRGTDPNILFALFEKFVAQCESYQAILPVWNYIFGIVSEGCAFRYYN